MLLKHKEGRMYIRGAWVDAGNGRRAEVVNPATGQTIGTIPQCERADVDQAIEAAAAAFKEWSNLTAEQRSHYLLSAAEKLAERADEIALILTSEQGKPLAEAKGEVLQSVKFLRWYSEEAKRVYGETIPASSPNKRLMVIRQPVGVVGAITPWNFPASMIARKLAPALAAGCTVVLKPASATPLTAVALFEVFEAAGFPAGVVNLVTGKGSEVGAAFTSHPAVRKLTFTGSTAVGKQLFKDAAPQLKKLSLELGGHAPFIVFEDADLDEAAAGCMISKFRNAGQTCICANRIYVHEEVMDAFAAKLVERVKAMRIGVGTEEGVTIGPLIDEAALAKVEDHVQDALSQGATIATGGKRWEAGTRSDVIATFYEPTVLTHVPTSAKICHEETFGPVAPLIPFRNEEEVIALANDVPYGLAAYVYTKDLARSYRVTEKLEYGMIGLNEPMPSAEVQAPFGGWKESGQGREGGHYGMDAFLEFKYVSIGI